MTTASSTRTRVLLLAAITAIGAALRYYALHYGLPAIYNPDEIPILSRALALAKGDLNPHNFLYPTLYFYELFAWEGLYYVLARAAGVYHSLGEFQNAFFVDPSRLVLVGRALTASFGVATVIAVYRFGATLFNRGVGLAAALFMAVAPFAVRDAHYVKLDVPTAFFVALTYVLLSRLIVDGKASAKYRWWLAGGFCGGLAMASQYYALFICVPFAVAAAVKGVETREWRRAGACLAVAALGTVLGFLAGCPFFFAEFGTAMRDIAGVRQVDIDRAVAGASGAFPTLEAYLHMLLTDAIGWPVSLGAIVGLATCGWKRSLLLLSFPVAFLAFIGHTVPESRYLNVVLPIVAVAGAAGLFQAAQRVGLRSPLALAVVAMLCAVPGFAGSLQSDRFYLTPDTRTQAAQFVTERIKPGSTVLVQPYSAPLHRSRDSIVEALRHHLGSEERASIKFQLQLAATPYPSPAYRLIYLGDNGDDPDKIYVSPGAFTAGTLEPLQQLGVEYVILKQYNVPNPALGPLESALRQHGQLMATFSPYRAGASAEERAATAPFLHNTATRILPALERPGPIVEIWQIR
jgi:hypothetical protein